ncbi:Uncharacterized membrane protein SpoIIM, required for sporulation [Amycolatopsis xylanica]|uniref:Uncharacterized membrane protein SpoIIM, required for sporulation n=1 Tax=Amycolatopsis xylanica TaxID=589385 RepID=A0A1H3SL60_9PSEU|nr:stage II sporulation protein M [Amycolatopsis xylanica]SDZ38315.1 Uncharacterized membrane protein SpoIIM, required for sporulation [Amycolatopsis xylanica]
MDVDVFVAAHRPDWDRLSQLTRRANRLRGAEADELVSLYQRAATHLSIIRSVAPDPALVSHLSGVVARARSAVTGTSSPAWREFGLFFTRRFPATVYLSRRWWVPTAVLSLAIATVLAAWIANDPEVRTAIAPPELVKEMTEPGGQYETYYSTGPASSFAFHVWTNNAWVAAVCLFFGVVFGLPVIGALWQNIQVLAVGGGLMNSVGRGDVFLGLIMPHGLLELTAVFVAAGTGLKLGWTVISPGRRSRAAALAEQGRSVVVMALGLACVLFVSGAIEGFVTPSGLPTWARIGIGAVVEVLFLAYVFVVGRRAARDGETGDVDARDAGDALPETG